jgi:Chaperone of endosialidase
MGIFDIFGTGDQQAAAQAQIAGLNSAYGVASGNINQGIGAINTGYSAALAPFTQNYGQAQTGVTALQNALGLGGPSGNTSALQALQATPGYAFQTNAGDAAINAQAAATGQNASGNQALALSKFNQGQAGTTYNNYVSQLMPFLGASGNAASGMAGVNTGQANALAEQYGNLANLGWQTQTGIGNANANADLSGLNASGNILGALGSIGSTAASLAPFLLSDINAKEDIEKVGELYDGQPVYKYRYVDSPIFQIGLIAQDVEKTNPAAVKDFGGLKAVNYNEATRFSADLARFLEAA